MSCGLATLACIASADADMSSCESTASPNYVKDAQPLAINTQYGYEIVTNVPRLFLWSVFISSNNGMAEVAGSYRHDSPNHSPGEIVLPKRLNITLFRLKGIDVDSDDVVTRLGRTMFYEPNRMPIAQHQSSGGLVQKDMTQLRRFGSANAPIVDINMPFSIELVEQGMLIAGVSFNDLFFFMDDVGVIDMKTQQVDLRQIKHSSTNSMFRVAVPEHRKNEFADFMKEARAKFNDATEINNAK